ncbi:beta-galactosidase trimerization domain-containing protein [Pendulispora albinea]|uniref:Beta-galactosidase trimerization domain-containing protein n=1 Tax=Pendulispora albinea TaxID=2741071 RepID=A0ABZ2LRJ4_9BACT
MSLLRRRKLRRPRSLWIPSDGQSPAPAPPFERGMARRDFLRMGAAALTMGAAPLGLGSLSGAGLAGCLPKGSAAGGIEPDGPPKAPPEHWVRDARTAGFEVMIDARPHELGEQLDILADSGVNVVEADCDLSAYLTNSEFDEQLAVLDLVAYGSHLRGMRCVAYYPTLEVLSAEAATAPHVLSKEHPDWLQIGIDGKPNMFVGGGGRVFWVDPGVESAWTCPLTGYLDYYLDRIRRLTATRLDGVWGDVPLLSDIEGVWPCTNEACRTKFKNDTGMVLPGQVNWDDPVFRRWVLWRHQLIFDFEQAILRAVKSVKASAEAIIETVTMDYNGGTIQGLDGAFAHAGELVRVWEVDAVSDGSAMRGGTADDWICMAVMMRHGSGSSFGQPSWIFTYGREEDDAERVMALAIATRNNPYETKIPLMCTTVGNAYRKRMYRWMDAQKDLYSLPGANRAAVLFSPASRDFLDRNSGVGLYASFYEADDLWWSAEKQDSALKMEYLADYRGTCKALIHAHVPFDALPIAAATPEMLASYKLLAIPSPASLSAATIQMLDAYVTQGGTVIVTGQEGGYYDEHGTARTDASFLRAIGITNADMANTSGSFIVRAKGRGTVAYTAIRAGQAYLQTTEPAMLAQYIQTAEKAGARVTSTAPKEVLMDLRRAPNGVVLVCASMYGLGTRGGGAAQYAQQDTTFRVSIPEEGKTPVRVQFSEPTAGASDRDLPFTRDKGLVSFDLTVRALALVRIELA